MPIKTTGTYKGKSNRLGGGGRFKQMVDAMEKKGMSAGKAKAIAASMGRKKYGAKKMASMAAAGRRRASRSK